MSDLKREDVFGDLRIFYDCESFFFLSEGIFRESGRFLKARTFLER